MKDPNMTRLLSILVLFPFALGGCDPATSPEPDEPSGGARGKADSMTPVCDDDTAPVCTLAEPECPDGSVVAVQGGCFTCADSETCEPLGLPANCDDGPAVCTATEPFCGPLAVAAQIGGCWQCVDAFSCEPIEPDVEPESSCVDACGGASDDGCWCDELCHVFGDCCGDIKEVCEDPAGPCDDGTDPVCAIAEPECADDEILAVQNGCLACVDPVTCQ